MLDGLDEVSSANFDVVVEAIVGLSGRLAASSPHSRLVLTMRGQFYQQVRERLDGTFPNVLTVQDFTPSDVYEFLTRWPFKSERQTQITHIYEQLVETPALYDLCTNPLILAMYVASNQSSANALPDTRSTFYSQVMVELLGTRRATQLRAPARKVERERREAVLGHLALNNMLGTKRSLNDIPHLEAIARIKSVYRCNTSDAEDRLVEIIRDTGIISAEKPGESLHFNHLTFCEYLAASECVARTDGWSRLMRTEREMLASDSMKSRLDEVIPFACAQAGREARPALLADVADLGNRRLFIRCLLETQGYEHTRTEEVLLAERDVLLSQPEDRWDRGWLDSFQLFVRVLRDLNSGLVPITDRRLESLVFFEALVSGSERRLLELFSGLAAIDPVSALRVADDMDFDVATGAPDLVVLKCDVPAFFALAVERMEATSADVTAWAKAIAEAALRSQAVAVRANKLAAGPALSKLADSSKRGRWLIEKSWRRRRTLYTDCLTVATMGRPSGQGTPSSSFPHIDALKKVRVTSRHLPPFLFLWWQPVGILFGSALTLLFALFVVFVVFRVIELTQPSPGQGGSSDGAAADGDGYATWAVSTAAGVAIALILMSYATYPYYRQYVFNRLLNLQVHAAAAVKFDWLLRLSLLQRVGVWRAWKLMVSFERSRESART